MGYKGIQRKLKHYLTKEWASEVKVNICQISTSRNNFKNMNISDESPIETFSVFKVANRQFDYFFI